MVLRSPVASLLGELRRLAEGNIVPSLDLVDRLEGELRRLESLARDPLRAGGGARIAKRRSPAVWRFRVVRWEDVELTFQPRGEAQPKTVTALRVYIDERDQNEGAPYWDFTKKRVQAYLRPLLDQLSGTGAMLEVVQDGDGPTAQFSVSVRPPTP